MAHNLCSSSFTLERKDYVTLPDTLTSSIDELYPDILGVIFRTCISLCDLKTITAFPCINKYWNQFTMNFFEGCDLNHICPELAILDAKTQKRECTDEPKIGKFTIFQAVKKIAPHVEDNAGVTLLTVIKGDTLNKLIKEAAQDGMEFIVVEREELGDVAVEQTYTILITDHVFIGSRNKNYNSQKDLAEGHGCQMPTAQEYATLCVLMQKIFQKCVYDTNVRSSTHVRGIPMIVGCFARTHLCIFGRNEIVDVELGVGGQWKF